MDPYATHLPILTAACLRTTGPICELGAGWYSTPLLHAFAASGRPVYTCERDAVWVEPFLAYHVGTHVVEHVDSYDRAALECEPLWSVAFIDHAPAERRVIDIARLAERCEFLVIHDTEPESENVYSYAAALALFRYRRDFTRRRPWTTVASNLRSSAELPEL